MLDEGKNLKDSVKDTSSMSNSLVSSLSSKSISYTKTNKLITALYMVTDMMEKDEPIRLKLRTLGIDILSDINIPKAVFDTGKVDQVLSFLNVAFGVRMMSEMNFNILVKEFTELKQSIQDFTRQNHSWLEGFLISPNEDKKEEIQSPSFRGTRIGVQKGSTLLRALNKVGGMDVLNNNGHVHHKDFEILKNKRRQDIISIIKTIKNTEGATIKDIKINSNGLLDDCGEKTLQRELVSMVKDNVLYKIGEKRWSRYFVK